MLIPISGSTQNLYLKNYKINALVYLENYLSNSRDYTGLNDFVKSRISEYPYLASKGAVLVSQEKTLDNNFFDYYNYYYSRDKYSGLNLQCSQTTKIESYTCVFDVIKILNKNGLQNYSNIIVPELVGKELMLVFAKVVKPSKTPQVFTDLVKRKINHTPYGVYSDFEINKSLISSFDTTYVENYSDILHNNFFKSLLKFRVSGVEVGDYIEVFKVYYSPSANFSEDIYFHSYLPSIQSNIIVVNRKGLSTLIKPYNGAKLTNQIKNDKATICSYNMDNLKSIEESNFNPYSELPYVRFLVSKYKEQVEGKVKTYEIIPDNWKKLGWVLRRNNCEFEVSEGLFNKNYLNKVSKEILLQNNSDIIKTFKIIHDSVINNLTIIPAVSKPRKSSRYYIKEGEIDRQHLFKLYADIFKVLKIKTDLCISKSKNYGTIDSTMVCLQDRDALFYSFFDEKNKRHFVFPSESENFKLNVDEIPAVMEGAQTVAIPIYNHEKNDTNVCFFELPKSKYTDNTTLKENFITINLKTKKTKDSSYYEYFGNCAVEKQQEFSGFFKERMKTQIAKQLTNYKNAISDSVSCKFNQLNTNNYKKLAICINLYNGNYLSTKDSITYFIPLKYLVNNNLVTPENIATRTYNWVENYAYNDKFYTELKIEDANFEILNIDDFNYSFSNEIGKYQVSMKKQDSTITISSEYLIYNNFIQNSEVPKLADLYNQTENYFNKLIIIKCK